MIVTPLRSIVNIAPLLILVVAAVAVVITASHLVGMVRLGHLVVGL